MFCHLIMVSAMVVNVADCGARKGGAENCTGAFRDAVAQCAAAGGGRVVVPEGTWFTGPIHLKSNVELHLEKGAVVEFSDDPKDCLPAVPSSWEGLECLNLSPLVYAYCCTNVAITGKGALRPRMDFWREMMKESKTGIMGARAILYKWGSEDYPVEKRDITKAHSAVLRPQCVQFNRCKGVRVEDVRIEDSPFWTIHLFMSEDVTIRRIDVCAHGFNNDGVDIEMTRNVLIEDSVFDQGDDGLVFKSGRNRDAWRVGRPTENVEARNCRFKTVGSLVGVGSELSGGVRNVYVHDCTVENACNLFYVKTNHRRGGFVENVRMENVKVTEVSQVLAVDTDVLYQWRKLPDYETRLTPISGLYMKNVTCARARTGVNINGDSRLPVRDVCVENVRIGRVQDFLSRVKYAENVDLSGLSCGERGKVETRWDAEYDPTVRRQRKVAFLGDSITDARHIGCRLNYWDFLSDELDFQPLVYGVNGQQWRQIPAQVAAMKRDGVLPDVISILMGTNDFNDNVPLGEWYNVVKESVNKDGVLTVLKKRNLSSDLGTFRGRINAGIAAVREAYPSAKILLLTPVHRGYAYLAPENVQPDESYSNTCGLFVDDYVAAVAEAGRIHSAAVVDLFATSGIYPLEPAHARDYFNSDRNKERTDFLHPNTAGHRRMADAIRPVLEDLLGNGQGMAPAKKSADE